MRSRCSAVGMTVLSLSLAVSSLTGGGARKSALPEPVFTRLVGEEAKFLQEELAKKKLTDKSARKVKGAALMVAAYAQANMVKTKDLAALRDRALALIKAVDAKKLAEAKKLATELPKAKGESAQAGPVPLNPYLKLEFVMRIFSSKRVGGFDLEKELETIVEMKGDLPADQKDKVVKLAYKIAVIGQLADAYAAEKDEGGQKTRKNWSAFATQMHTAAVALADAAKTGKGVSPAAEKLSATCTKCHDVFR